MLVASIMRKVCCFRNAISTRSVEAPRPTGRGASVSNFGQPARNTAWGYDAVRRGRGTRVPAWQELAT
jgi:hypothetical protein